MARALGQIDTRKDEAILDAASRLFANRGLSVSMEEIARSAGVSKQTRACVASPPQSRGAMSIYQSAWTTP